MMEQTDDALAADPGFRQLVECLPVGVVVFRSGKVLYLNAMLRSYLGLGQDPVTATLDELIQRIFVGSDVAGALARLALIEHPDGHSLPLAPIERQILGADGRPRVAELKTVRVQFDGEPAHLTMIRDLTAERRVQARLASLDRMAAVGAVASGLAHELNNPLAVLLGHLELLVERVPAALQGAEPHQPTAPSRDLPSPGHDVSAQDILKLLAEASHSATAVREVMAAFRSLSAAAKAPASPPNDPTAKPRPTESPRRGSLLVIDDDPLVASILQRVLAAEHDVRVEVSALAALRLLQTEFFDAVVTDVMMPDLSGLALFEALRATRPAQAERLVFVTGGVWAGDAEDSLVATGRPILQKPFDIDTLRGTIRRIVSLEPAAPSVQLGAQVDPEPPSP